MSTNLCGDCGVEIGRNEMRCGGCAALAFLLEMLETEGAVDVTNKGDLILSPEYQIDNPAVDAYLREALAVQHSGDTIEASSIVERLAAEPRGFNPGLDDHADSAREFMHEVWGTP